MAESFGEDAERYDRTRPRYPEALVRRIVDACPGPDVLDVGCGTGIVARQFRAAGCTVLGVEPDARMAGLARRSGIATEVARWEEWDPAGRTFDAVVSGQAWHWIDPVEGAVQAARVLRPGGLLALFWNVPELPVEVMEAFAAVFERVVPDSPFDFRALSGGALTGYARLLDKVAEGIGGTGRFGGPEQWRCAWEWSYTRDAWLAQMPTFGPLTRLPKPQLEQVLDGAGAAVDALGGTFTARYTTMAVGASLLPG
ncbi:methyltransferase type 11 [Streptomyces mangrovisoli]|uniref:Methyltransferase type 11 n=1 Tax=Streptomyces mangrovisoli TaxID=1428628 RepID=A0A1J4NVM9_9ACTN|nr:methyltransferase type 11 [Streptomyces mangrovisoli]